MDTQEFIELDLQLGEALSEIRRLQGLIKDREDTIDAMRSLLNTIIKTAQDSYSLGPERTRRFPEASGKEVSKEAF
jgi:hypothetical protein